MGLGHRQARQHLLHGGPEPGSGDRAAVAGRRVVEGAAVDEPVIRVVQEEVRGAGGPVGEGGPLSGVEQIGKSQPVRPAWSRRPSGPSSGATPVSLLHTATAASRGNSATSSPKCFSRCRTKGQWLDMKATSRAGAPAKSARRTVRPSSEGRAKSGAGVPRGTMKEDTGTVG